MFDKLQFWKKNEDPLGANPFDTPSAEGHPFGADTSNPFTSAQPNQGPEVPSFDQQGTNDPFATPQASMDYTQTQTTDPFAQQQPPQQMQSQPSTSPQTLGGAEFGQAQVVSQQSSPQMQNEMQKKDVELILSRLDLIKSELDNVQHKLSMLEQQNQKPKW